MALVRSDSSEATTRIGRLPANSSSTPFHPQVKTVYQLWASYDLTATTRESCSRLVPADRYSRLGSRGYRMLKPNNRLRRTVAPMTPRLAGLLAAAAIATECAILVVGGCSDLPRRHLGVISDPGFHGSARRRWRSRRLRPRLEPGRAQVTPLTASSGSLAWHSRIAFHDHFRGAFEKRPRGIVPARRGRVHPGTADCESPEPHANRWGAELRHQVVIMRCCGHRCRNSDKRRPREIARYAQRTSQLPEPTA